MYLTHFTHHIVSSSARGKLMTANLFILGDMNAADQKRFLMKQATLGQQLDSNAGNNFRYSCCLELSCFARSPKQYSRMDSKRLFILLTIFTLIICVLMDQGGAFDRPTRRRPRSRSCSRRLKGCSRRRSSSGIKAEDIRPIDINDVSTILVGVQFLKPF